MLYLSCFRCHGDACRRNGRRMAVEWPLIYFAVAARVFNWPVEVVRMSAPPICVLDRARNSSNTSRISSRVRRQWNTPVVAFLIKSCGGGFSGSLCGKNVAPRVWFGTVIQGAALKGDACGLNARCALTISCGGASVGCPGLPGVVRGCAGFGRIRWSDLYSVSSQACT